VLLAFGPFVRSGNAAAIKIHQEYLVSHSQPDFLKNARQFLIDEGEGNNASAVTKPPQFKTVEEIEAEALAAQPPKQQPPPPQSNVTNGMTQQPASSIPSPPPGIYTATRQIIDTSQLQSSMQSMSIGQRNNSNLAPTRAPPGMGYSPSKSSVGVLPPMMHHSSPTQMHTPCVPPPTRTAIGSPLPSNNTSSILPARESTPKTTPQKSTSTTTTPPTPAKPAKVWRTQTRLEEQPGKVFANDIPAQGKSLTVRPRAELTARWVLPLRYLRDRAMRRFEEKKALAQTDGNMPPPPQNLTIRDALKHLAVGLFRRGVSDNGSQAAIVSKEILTSDGGGKDNSGRPDKDYPFGVDQQTDSIFGTVPFYSPRTPGNVVFRLYFEDEPHVTLATGTCIHVIPSDVDCSSVLRFILSNFKSKKSAGISSMQSLASLLDSFAPNPNSQQRNWFDDAGRVAWGCICESRKVIEQAAATYVKNKSQLKELAEEWAEADKIKSELPQLDGLDICCSTNGESNENDDDDVSNEMKERKQKISFEQFSNDRKWNDMQLAYSSVLKVR
jgi:hypothetical protein